MGTFTTTAGALLLLSTIIGVMHHLEIIDLNSVSLKDVIISRLFPEVVLMGAVSEKGKSQNGEGSLFTKDQLKTLKHSHLAIAGQVFDVSKGERHYGVDGHYNFFTGVDGTRAFVTGEFNEAGLVDDIEGLDAEAIQSIEDWRLMYHKDYTLVGKVIGNFYDVTGQETEAKKKYDKLLKEAALNKSKEAEIKALYPPCNAEFKNKSSKVWCSTMSGGIRRSWAGVPRKLFKAGGKDFRCACIRTTGPPSSDMNRESHTNRGDLDNPNLREYENCTPTSDSCWLNL